MKWTAIPTWLMALTGVMFHSSGRWSSNAIPGSSLELDQDLPLLDGVADVGVDLGDLAGDGCCDHGFHFHRFEDHQDIVDLDDLPDLGRDAGDRAREGAAADLALVGHGGTRGPR